MQVAIPVCLGDYYGSYRVVGTTPGMFNDMTYGGKKYEFSEGANFVNRKNFNDGVIGSRVAREHNLHVGSTFRPTHGMPRPGTSTTPSRSSACLKPTGTPVDRRAVHQHGRFLP